MTKIFRKKIYCAKLPHTSVCVYFYFNIIFDYVFKNIILTAVVFEGKKNNKIYMKKGS